MSRRDRLQFISAAGKRSGWLVQVEFSKCHGKVGAEVFKVRRSNRFRGVGEFYKKYESQSLNW